MPAEPTYDPALGEQKFKTAKHLVDVRGPEEIHTELIHKQYGIAAVSGGFIASKDFDFIRVFIYVLMKHNSKICNQPSKTFN